MTKKELYQKFLQWQGSAEGYPFEKLFDIPVADFDVSETEGEVVNRLYYLVPRLTGARLSSFVFYEENLFQKDASGNLELLQSTLHMQDGE